MVLAAVFNSKNKLMLKRILKPEVESKDEVLIKVKATGLCGSDAPTLINPSPDSDLEGKVIGHEVAGIVEDKGSGVKRVEKGDHAIIDPVFSCGKCVYCRQGRKNLCPDKKYVGWHVPGGLSEYIKVKEKYIYKVSTKVPFHIAALVEPMADVTRGTAKVKPGPRDKVVILGAGSIGLIFYKVLSIMGVSDIIVSDISDYKIKSAKNMGVDNIINSKKENLKEAVLNSFNGFADIVIDASGIPLSHSLDLVKDGGKILLFGVINHIKEIPQNNIVEKELSIFGTCNANKEDLIKAIDLVESNAYEFEKIITHKFSLNDIGEAIKVFNNKQAVKIIIEPGKR
jgi:threonine dehydrogenase-like Zn-dependent dehydrogenase